MPADDIGPDAAAHVGSESETASVMNRRRFLALLGASAAVGVAGCKLDSRGRIVPYVDQPADTVLGIPRFYASTLTRYPDAPAVLITTREGRPIKLDGNPAHPASSEALGAYGQSATLSLYDPDRLKGPTRRGSAVTWDAADVAIRSALAEAVPGRRHILLITPALASPTARALVTEFSAAYPTTWHLPIETFHAGEVAEGRRRVLGAATIPRIAWDVADVIVSLDADFLAPSFHDRANRGFASRRQPDGNALGMNRLWVVEGPMTLTGTNADHHVRLRSSQHGLLLAAMLNEVVVVRRLGPLAGATEPAQSLAPFDLRRVTGLLGLDERVVRAMVEDLVAHPGRGAVLAGDHQPAHVHALATALNVSLGNEGAAIIPAGPVPQVAAPNDLAAAMADMTSGAIAVVINLDTNPVYSLPRDSGFAQGLGRVPLVVSSSLLPDETGQRAHYVLPCTHDLESWGDSDAHAEALSLQQPAILPLFDARQIEESLLRWLPPSQARPATYYDYLRARWRQEVYPRQGVTANFERFWRAALHDGVLAVPAASTAGAQTPTPVGQTPTAVGAAVRDAVAALNGQQAGGVDIVLMPSASTYDGRFANNAWLQELPHPVTSQVWGNGAMMSPGTAEGLRRKDGDAVTVSVDGRTITLPVVVQPGCADDVIGIELGYGRKVAGSVGSNVGVDVNVLRRNRGGVSPWLYVGARVAPATSEFRVVKVQEHYRTLGRPVIAESTLAGYRAHPKLVEEAAQDTAPSIGGGSWKYPGQKWGMVIDLGLCTGCNACMVACMAENNVPTVGLDQVARGRRMHWLRIDTYYHGEPENPQIVHQPMLCQQCTNAPCEYVCPVVATVHSPDGINEQVYNRCVGTRYCGNNCPYKVRRFNFFAYQHLDRIIPPKQLLFNPEVTVRSRGVMEKCMFCIQRIRLAQQAAMRDKRPMVDGEVKTACQQACPANAIVFGDLNDSGSVVRRLSGNPRGYHVLAELGTKPTITYLAKIRNPYPDVVT